MTAKNILSVFDTEAQSEQGAWLHLVTPGTDELAYADDARKKPLRIKLKGPESDTWTAFQRKVMQQQDGKKDKRQGQPDNTAFILSSGVRTAIDKQMKSF